MRINVSIDDAHAAQLEELAAKAHVQVGTLARSMLLGLLDNQAAATAPDVGVLGGAGLVGVLDGIGGSWQRVEDGRADVAAGRTVPLDAL